MRGENEEKEIERREETVEKNEQKSPPSSPAQPSKEDEPRTPSPSQNDDAENEEEKKSTEEKKKEEEEKKEKRKQQCEQLYQWLSRMATKPGRMLVNKDAIIDDQVKMQEEELERRNRAMCLRFKLVTAEGEAHQPRRGARGKEKAFRAAGLHDFTLVEESEKMFSSPMTRVWQPVKPAIIRVGDEYQAQVPEFDEEVKKAIVDDLEHFTEKETQMLGVRFWPLNNNDQNNNNNTNTNTNSPTRKSTRKRSKSREPAEEEEEKAAKRLAPSENNANNGEQAKNIEVVGVAGAAAVVTTAKAELDSNNAPAVGAVVVKTETQGEEVKDPDLVAYINAQGQEEIIRIVRVPLEDIAEARAKFKREVGDSLHVQTSFGLHDMGVVVANAWSEEERDIFTQHVTKNCDNLRPMKPLLPNKTMSQIVSYYYNVWQTTRANPRRVDIWHPPEEKRSHKRERERALAKALAAEKRLRKQQQKKERKLAIAPEIILKQRCKKEVAQMVEWIRSSCATNPRHAAYNANRAETVTKLRQHMMERVHSLRLYSQNDKDIFDDYKQYFFQRMTSVKL